MIARTDRPNTKSSDAALAAFTQKKAEIDTMLNRLQALSGDHFGLGPDHITWSHVTLLVDYVELLKRITERAFKEGAYAI